MERAQSALGLAASPQQVGLMFASALAFEALSRPEVWGPFTPQWIRDKVATLSKRDKRDFEVAVASSVHATVACAVSLTVILRPDATIGIGDVAKLYGYSPRSQFAFGVSSGFFLWDLFTVVTDPEHFDLGFLVHAVVCLTVYVLGQYPVFHYYGPAFLLFELSTPLLNLRKALLALGQKGSPLFVRTERAFGVVFLVARILFGFPISYSFLRDVVLLLNSDRAHNRRALQYYFVADVLMCGLNAYWLSMMVRKRRRHGQDKGGKKPAAAAAVVGTGETPLEKKAD